MSLGDMFGGGGDAEKAAEKAADAQVESTKLANETILKMFNMGRGDQAPWRIGGANALMAMMDMMGLQRPTKAAMSAGMPQDEGASSSAATGASNALASGQGNSLFDPSVMEDILRKMGYDPKLVTDGKTVPTNSTAKPGSGDVNASIDQYDETLNMPTYQWQASPGYGWRLNEGVNAINKSGAGQGNLLSGATLKAMNRFGQGLASEEFGNAFNRLGTLAGVGSSTANQGAAMANQTGQAMGQNMISAGDARASGYINAANAKAQGGQNSFNNILGLIGGLGGLFGL